jgi:hypothetical protein
MEQRVSLVTLGVADVGRAQRFYEAPTAIPGRSPTTRGGHWTPTGAPVCTDGDGSTAHEPETPISV